MKLSRLRCDNHTVSVLADHMVFCPKYRGKVLVGNIQKETYRVIQNICSQLEIEIIKLGVNSDHVHLLYRYPPKYSLSFITQKIKGISSRRLRKKFPELKRWCKKGLWAPSCYHGSVGQGFEVVENYIRSQSGGNIGNIRRSSMYEYTM